MKTNSIEDYFFKHIMVISVFMNPEYQITHKEAQFLAKCCTYRYLGMDIEDFDVLCAKILEDRVVNNRSSVSLYKSKLYQKRWIRGGKDGFELPGALNIAPGQELSFKITLEYDNHQGNTEEGQGV